MDTSIARRSDGKLIRAEQGIDKSLPFNCPGCKQEVYAVTEGKIQRPHFRHKSLDGLKGCSEPESYIHWVTKELFADNYEKVTSFYISLEILKTCIHAKYSSYQKTEQVKIDLKKIYPYIQVEEKEGSFRPDCLLFNDKGEKLFFEVCYSSRVSEDKIKSGIPIIELYTVNEQTIDSVIRGTTMKKLLLFTILTGLLVGLTGCGDEAAQKEAEKKAKREHMKQHVDTSGEKKITKLPF